MDAGDVEEGWVVVDADNRFFADAARLSDAWPFDDSGDTGATFVGGAFAGSERDVICRAAIAVETSVVASQKDQGVLSLADFFQLLHDSPNTFIHAFDHGCVGGIVVTALFAIIQDAFVLFDQVRAALDRSVHIVVPEGEEEGFFVSIIDKVLEFRPLDDR